MISETRTTWEIACDRCAEGAAVLDKQRDDVPDWGDMFARIKRLGWRVFKGGDNAFAHCCPDCAGADPASPKGFGGRGGPDGFRRRGLL